MVDAKPLYNPNDGFTGRDGGPYLDLEQAKVAETHRALVEGREPDYDNVPATAGIPLQTAEKQFATIGVNNLPSQSDRGVVDAHTMFDGAVNSDDNLLQPAGELPAAAWEEKTNPESPEGTFDVATQTVINEDTVDSDGKVVGLNADGEKAPVDSGTPTDSHEG